MKKFMWAVIVLLLALLPLSLSSAQWGPVWHGPRSSVSWSGMNAPEAAAPKPVSPVATPAPAAAVDDTPVWVGYVKRNESDWYFRLILSNGKSEMVKRGGSTSDGWLVSGQKAQANKPTHITLTRGDVEKTLTLTPQ